MRQNCYEISSLQLALFFKHLLERKPIIPSDPYAGILQAARKIESGERVS